MFFLKSVVSDIVIFKYCLDFCVFYKISNLRHYDFQVLFVFFFFLKSVFSDLVIFKYCLDFWIFSKSEVSDLVIFKYFLDFCVFFKISSFRYCDFVFGDLMNN